jgi:DNA-binding LacI/PurR family transcriptional regulator
MPPPEPKKNRIGIREIAKQAGVSIMTVSLSLRNHPKISEATRKRVQEVAARLGYRPDPEIARLMTRLHRQAGDSVPMAIVDLSTTRGLTSLDYTERVRRGAIAQAEAMGYIATCFHSIDCHGDLNRLLGVLGHRGITGVLLVPPVAPVQLERALDWSHFSVVSATYAINPPQFHRVVPHQFLDMCRLIKELESRGFKRIGAVFHDTFEERTYYHFTAAILLHNYADNIYRLANLSAANRDGLVAWVREKQPDALVCRFSGELRAALACLPHPPTVIGLGKPEAPDLAYWDERPEEIGADAARMLAGMMQHHESGLPESPRTSMIHGAFNPGPLAAGPSESTARAKLARGPRKQSADR